MDLTNKWKLVFDIILKRTFGFKATDSFFSSLAMKQGKV